MAKQITLGGHSRAAILRGVNKLADTVKIKKAAKPVTGDMIAQVGAIASNGDETIGNLIARAMQAVGKDGVITVEFENPVILLTERRSPR